MVMGRIFLSCIEYRQDIINAINLYIIYLAPGAGEVVVGPWIVTLRVTLLSMYQIPRPLYLQFVRHIRL